MVLAERESDWSIFAFSISISISIDEEVLIGRGQEAIIRLLKLQLLEEITLETKTEDMKINKVVKGHDLGWNQLLLIGDWTHS